MTNNGLSVRERVRDMREAQANVNRLQEREIISILRDRIADAVTDAQATFGMITLNEDDWRKLGKMRAQLASMKKNLDEIRSRM